MNGKSFVQFRWPLLLISVFTLLTHACATYSQARVQLSQEYVILGDEYYDAENYSRAGSLYQKALELYPGNWGGRYGLIQTYLSRGDVTRAEELFQEAGKELNNDGHRELQAYFAARSGDYETAGELYSLLLEEHPENSEYRFNLALTHIARDDSARAYTLLEQVVDSRDSFLPARIRLAQLDAENGDYLSASLWLEEQNVAEYPHGALILARSYRELEYYDRFFTTADQIVGWSGSWQGIDQDFYGQLQDLFFSAALRGVEQGLKDARIRSYLVYVSDELEAYDVEWVGENILPGLQPEERFPETLAFIRAQNPANEVGDPNIPATETQGGGEN
ncbi:tetratricopeptide repeat protein [Salinispira pacifica]|uniref:Tetratricopeptide repeat protein n=1 Tax=Salinispira pacifica TaxID=1307761 RepID=V5WFI9_9SPIO|nr:tetratricopeptide repeat protein [Salinispira pacifica]AHC14538.1 hypothetical protein L21SP2_1135 [Salinispira pacifica]